MPEVGPTPLELAEAQRASEARSSKIGSLVEARQSIRSNIDIAGMSKDSKRRYTKRINQLNRRIKKIDRRIGNPFKILYRNVEARAQQQRQRAANAFGINASMNLAGTRNQMSKTGPVVPPMEAGQSPPGKKLSKARLKMLARRDNNQRRQGNRNRQAEYGR